MIGVGFYKQSIRNAKSEISPRINNDWLQIDSHSKPALWFTKRFHTSAVVQDFWERERRPNQHYKRIISEWLVNHWQWSRHKACCVTWAPDDQPCTNATPTHPCRRNDEQMQMCEYANMHNSVRKCVRVRFCAWVRNAWSRYEALTTIPDDVGLDVCWPTALTWRRPTTVALLSRRKFVKLASLRRRLTASDGDNGSTGE